MLYVRLTLTHEKKFLLVKNVFYSTCILQLTLMRRINVVNIIYHGVQAVSMNAT